MKKNLEKIAATFKSNHNKAAYWAQLVGSVLIVGLAIGTVFFKLQIDSSAALMIITGIGAVLSLWGTITDNSILEDTGDTIKTKANVLASTEQSVVAALTEAQEKIEATKTSLSTATSHAIADAYSTAASAAANGDTDAASTAATLAANLTVSSTSTAASTTNSASESVSQTPKSN